MYSLRKDVQLILGSSSPRRKELLSSIGLSYDIASPNCDETVLKDEPAKDLVFRLSRAKAESIAKKYMSSWVIGADTTVTIDNEILNKPADEKEAFYMLEKISGRWHQVWGGIALINLHNEVTVVETYCTEVLMRDLSKSDIEKFIATGEPMDKAGAYAIQGIGAALVSEIKGSYSNVVGLNVTAVLEMLRHNNLLA